MLSVGGGLGSAGDLVTLGFDDEAGFDVALTFSDEPVISGPGSEGVLTFFLVMLWLEETEWFCIGCRKFWC